MLDVENKNPENGIFDHLKNTPDHTISWDKMDIITRESDWYRRRMAESLCINAINPGRNLSNLMNIEKGKNVDSRWLEFNESIRMEFHLDT